MALILHIADLHLVSPATSRPIDDHKAGVVPSGDRTTHYELLRVTLQRLGERLFKDGRVLDAIIVTGDISDKNNEGGYHAFLELLDALGPSKPAPNRIVVSTGNHDVAPGLPADDPRRYDKFVKFIRGAGLVTPVLTSVDKLPLTTAEAPKHLIAFDDMQVIPIDSSAYSQVLVDVGISDPSWANLERVLASDTAELHALRKLRIADAARVSGAQLEAIRQILASITAAGRLPLRIAVLHHHLLPVSQKEEVKAFESMTNLGLVRQFVREQGIAIALHGHKHARFSYQDYISSFEGPLDKPWPLRVISGAAASIDLDQTDVFRLIELCPDEGLIKVERVPACLPGMTLAIGASETLTFSRPGTAQILETAGCIVIDGREADVVYRRLIATISARVGEVDHVICRIEHSPQLNQIAPLYPGVPPPPGTPEAEDKPDKRAGKRLEQFRDLVTWWQFPSVPLSPWDQPAFTHGSRIRKYNGHHDQIQAVIESLEADPKTSRAIVVLLNPPADRISARDVPFPSFCLVQFKAQLVEGGTSSLNCTAYFRKQEVRYWWLVNLAELASLQREICDALGQRRHVKELRSIFPGSITTIAARAHVGQSAPKVQVPLVDRYNSLSRERLFAMVNSLVWEHMPGREECAEEWQRLFFELNPPETPDMDGLAIAQEGLKYLRDEIGRHIASTESRKDESLNELHRVLERLLSANREFAMLQMKEEATPQKYNAWRSEVKPLIERIIELSYRRVMASERANEEV